MLTANPALSTDSASASLSRYLFVLQLTDGRYLIGQATNPCKRIAAINSGCHPSLSKSLQVKRLLAVKPIDDERNLRSTVYKFCAAYGSDSVLAV
jgi:hypothetical protein